MHIDLAISFNNGNITKTAIEELALKHDISLEYRTDNSIQLLNVKKGGVIVTRNISDADVVVLIDSFTGQPSTLSIYSISIIRVFN